MAKLHFLPLLAALCVLSSFLGLTLAEPKPAFTVQGRVYCDNCRAGFETSATEYIEGAKVKLECRHYSNDTIMHATEGVTDNTGTYNLEVEDDHQEEICEVYLVHSPMSGCSEIMEGRNRARVMLTQDNGIHDATRYANSLGFLKEEPLPICGELLRQYSLGDEE